MPAKNNTQEEEVIGGGFRPRPETDAMRVRKDGYESEKAEATRAAEQADASAFEVAPATQETPQS